MCERGRPVRKTNLAETLWPDAAPENAMSSLYKVCRYIRGFSMNGCNIPITESHGEVWLDMADVACDLDEFEKCYADRNNFESCASAVELYRAQLFFSECFEWVALLEAYYDIRYVEMVEILVSHHTRLNNRQMADYYKRKME